MAQKKFQDLNLNNAFLFAAALEDPETCRTILEMILNRPVPTVTVHSEHSILYSSDFRYIRLDIYAKDEMLVEYNIEMQNEDKKNLAKRARFHQAEMDVASLNPGDDFNKLGPGIVIFICCYDPYGEGLYRYTFKNICEECNLDFGDETCKIILSTKGKNEKEVPRALVDFLKYVENSTDAFIDTLPPENTDIRRLHDRVKKLKRSRTWEGRYMRFEELLQDSMNAGLEQGRQEGLEQGRQEGLEQGKQEGLKQGKQEGLKQGKQEGLKQGKQEGQELFKKLIQCMTEHGETDKIPSLAADDAFLQEKLKQYHLV